MNTFINSLATTPFAAPVIRFGRTLKMVSRDSKGKFRKVEVVFLSRPNAITKECIQLIAGDRIVRTMPIAVAKHFFANTFARKIQLI